MPEIFKVRCLASPYNREHEAHVPLSSILFFFCYPKEGEHKPACFGIQLQNQSLKYLDEKTYNQLLSFYAKWKETVIIDLTEE